MLVLFAEFLKDTGSLIARKDALGTCMLQYFSRIHVSNGQCTRKDAAGTCV